MISFASAVGNLFNRVGRCGQLLADIKSFQLTLESDMINTTTGVVAQYNTESDLQAEIGSVYISVLSGLEGVCSTAQQLAQDTFNRVVFRDNPLLNQNLQQSNTLASIDEVIRQMGLAGATILQMTVTAAAQTFPTSPPTYFANPTGTTPGNAAILMSSKRPFDGRSMENAFAETLTFLCTADSYTGGATAFNETYSLTGQGAETDLFAFDWPLGSNCSTSVSAIDGDTSGGSGNFLAGSNFATWTGGVPNGWTLVAGGSAISQNTSITFGLGSSLLITGDAASLPQIFQPFSGTAQTQYGFNVWARRGGSVITAGTLFVELVDEHDNLIEDNAGVANQTSFPLTSLTVNWTPLNVPFRLPTILPTTVNLQLRIGTPIDSGGLVYLAKSALGTMTQTYVGGCFGCVFAGSIPAVANDYGYAVVTNSRGAGGTLTTWQTALYQLLDPYVSSNEIIFPSSLTPTISDSLL